MEVRMSEPLLVTGIQPDPPRNRWRLASFPLLLALPPEMAVMALPATAAAEAPPAAAEVPPAAAALLVGAAAPAVAAVAAMTPAAAALALPAVIAAEIAAEPGTPTTMTAVTLPRRLRTRLTLPTGPGGRSATRSKSSR